MVKIMCGNFLNLNLLRSMCWRPGLNTESLEHDITGEVCCGGSLHVGCANAECCDYLVSVLKCKLRKMFNHPLHSESMIKIT